MESHKILVIDDDSIRRKKIASKIQESFSDLEIHQADCFNSGKEKLRAFHYFVVLMDMALPLRSGETQVDQKSGLKLLQGLTEGKYKAFPSRIIGFTALLENKEELEKSFEPLGFQLHRATRYDYSWLKSTISQIGYSLQAAASYDRLPNDIAVLSVHGIETSGKWQEQLHKLVEQQNKNVQVSNLQFKFEKFSLVRFLVPFLREKMVSKFEADLDKWFLENQAKRIICFSHSFGTYILVHALERLSKKHDLDNLGLILLSGSVLKQDHDFTKLLSFKNVRIVNECGKQDVPLLLSKALGIGTGMAGRLGFNGLMDDRFVNRGYKGGHSVFFENDYKIMKDHWLPLADKNSILEPFNLSNEESKIDITLEYLAKILSKIKYVINAVFLIAPLAVFWCAFN